MNTHRLYIIKGLPGSGKSTLAKQLIQEAENRKERVAHFESDMFFLYDGSYYYTQELIRNAHDWCYQNIVKALFIDQVDVAIVSNTFTQKWEYQRYIDLCKNSNISVIEKYPSTSWAWDVNECFMRNTHNVPKHVIQKMKDRFEH